MKLRLFNFSLTKTAFLWYSTLLGNSIMSWNDTESKFHKQFYRIEPKVTIGDLAKVVQELRESVERYMAMFRIE